ncbi:Inactive tyrosine-protein kinase transmembrane receptor ror1 [Mactra antiquata]
MIKCAYYEVSELKECAAGNDRCADGGQVSSTVKGKTCQRWDQHNPHPHKYRDINMFPDDSFENLSNFCRDPNDLGLVWCYTLDPSDKLGVCGVTRCLPECYLECLNTSIHGTMSK